tara:strand:- start:69 stop:290 length:222 start_codon:yes stop_codon:yes gene_type:complete
MNHPMAALITQSMVAQTVLPLTMTAQLLMMTAVAFIATLIQLIQKLSLVLQDMISSDQIIAALYYLEPMEKQC